MSLRSYAIAAVGGVLLLGCASTRIASNDPPVNVFLTLAHQEQDINLCLPTAASMILQFYGTMEEPRFLKALATPPRSNFAGTYMKDVEMAMRRLGYIWKERCFDLGFTGFRNGLAELKRNMVERRPAIVGVHSRPIGHAVVLVGVDETRKELTFLDPAEPWPGLWTVTEEQFVKVWRETVIRKRCVIITQPKSHS